MRHLTNASNILEDKYILYSEYPLWQLKEWKERAWAAGDNTFVQVIQIAIESKEEKDIMPLTLNEQLDKNT